MRKTLGVCLLTLLLTAPAAAGEMPNGSPTPQPARAIQEPINFAKEQATQTTTEDWTQDTLAQILLTVLLSVLS